MQAVLFDKLFEPRLEYELGKIGIRVVVFAKKQGDAASVDDDVPLDLQSGEDFASGEP